MAITGISGIGAAGAAGAAGGDVAERIARLRDALGKGGVQGGLLQGVGGDDARRMTVDIGKGDNVSFGETLTRALNEVSKTQDKAEDYVQKFLHGEPVELHQVMAASEEASLSLELLVELRNKLTEAYRTVMQMQS